MNTSFTLKNVEITIGDETVKIGEFSTKVEDYNLLDGLKVAKELPSIIRELKDILIEGIHEANGEVHTNIHDIPNPFEPPFDNIDATIKQHAEFVKNNQLSDEEFKFAHEEEDKDVPELMEEITSRREKREQEENIDYASQIKKAQENIGLTLSQPPFKEAEVDKKVDALFKAEEQRVNNIQYTRRRR